jgi:hypothetical protein
MLKQKASETVSLLNIKEKLSASDGWLESFLKRNSLVTRRKTTVCQKLPPAYKETILSFLCYFRNLKRLKNYKATDIYAMDETAIWMNYSGDRTLDFKGNKSIPIKTFGNENLRLTMVLTVRGDGKKIKPYILLNRKRKIKNLKRILK